MRTEKTAATIPGTKRAKKVHHIRSGDSENGGRPRKVWYDCGVGSGFMLPPSGHAHGSPEDASRCLRARFRKPEPAP